MRSQTRRATVALFTGTSFVPRPRRHLVRVCVEPCQSLYSFRSGRAFVAACVMESDNGVPEAAATVSVDTQKKKGSTRRKRRTANQKTSGRDAQFEASDVNSDSESLEAELLSGSDSGSESDAILENISTAAQRLIERKMRSAAAAMNAAALARKSGVPLANVLLLHTGGTLGMDPNKSFEPDEVISHTKLKEGTGGIYPSSLRPGYLEDLLEHVPELQVMANIDLRVVFNMDSSRVGPKEWIKMARLLDKHRDRYDAFVVVHGTDTLAYTAAALSLMLAGFGKPIVITGSQLPLLNPRTDARQNLIDSLVCATAGRLHEVAVCFGGLLLRGNRAQKTSTSVYRAFTSATYPPLATLGVDINWNDPALLERPVAYRPRFKLEPNVIRVPIIPGVDPRIAYGDIASRGVRGIVIEAFGVGNMPDQRNSGWLPWLREITRNGDVLIYLSSQCQTGALSPELYKSGSIALKYGVYSANQMTPECACVKLMLCLAHHDLNVNFPFAGEL